VRAQLATKHSEKYNAMAAELAKEMAAKHDSPEAIPPEEINQAIEKLQREASGPPPK
jgi:hypothetical protein